MFWLTYLALPVGMSQLIWSFSFGLVKCIRCFVCGVMHPSTWSSTRFVFWIFGKLSSTNSWKGDPQLREFAVFQNIFVSEVWLNLAVAFREWKIIAKELLLGFPKPYLSCCLSHMPQFKDRSDCEKGVRTYRWVKCFTGPVTDMGNSCDRALLGSGIPACNFAADSGLHGCMP